MKILIVYEEVPEDTKIFSVEVTPTEWEWMRLCQHNYVNTDMPEDVADACNKLTAFLTDKKKLDMDLPVLLRGESYDYLLHTGWIL